MKRKRILGVLLVVGMSMCIISGCVNYQTEIDDLEDYVSEEEDMVEEDTSDYEEEEDEDISSSVVNDESDTQTEPVQDSESTSEKTNDSEIKYKKVTNFVIEGKWKNVGTYTWGQVQEGAIIIFNGTNCNFFSPKDTYAFYQEGDYYRLDCTSLLSDTLSFKVKIVDENNIHVFNGSNILELKRVG